MRFKAICKQSQKRNSVHLALLNNASPVLALKISERLKCVDCKQRKKNGAPVPHELDVPPEFNIE